MMAYACRDQLINGFELAMFWSTNLSNISSGASPLPNAGVSFRHFSQGYSPVIRLGSASAAVGSIPLRLFFRETEVE
jgi:hypothetical protein